MGSDAGMLRNSDHLAMLAVPRQLDYKEPTSRQLVLQDSTGDPSTLR